VIANWGYLPPSAVDFEKIQAERGNFQGLRCKDREVQTSTQMGGIFAE
jgi:hypothetical protein